MKTVLIKKSQSSYLKNNGEEVKIKFWTDRRITLHQLKRIIEKHYQFLKKNEGGERAELSGKILSNKNLSGTDFSFADLAAVDFTSSKIVNVNFSYALLSGSDFRGAILLNVNFDKACLLGAVFNNEIFKNTEIYQINFIGAYRPEGLKGYMINEDGYIIGKEGVNENDEKKLVGTGN